jgi:hypothetical protein
MEATIVKDLFKYIGLELRNDYYKPGRTYLLEINGFRKPYIVAPVRIEYKSWEAFLAEWERV